MKRQKQIKAGDTVTPTDGSWAVGARENKFVHKSGREINRRNFKVIATDLKVPPIEFFKFDTSITFSGESVVNDTLIQAEDNGEYVFIRSGSLKLVKPEPKPVSFMEAVKAYSEGKTIVCNNCGSKYTYQPRGIPNTMVDTENVMAVSCREILNGTWFIKED